MKAEPFAMEAARRCPQGSAGEAGAAGRSQQGRAGRRLQTRPSTRPRAGQAPRPHRGCWLKRLVGSQFGALGTHVGPCHMRIPVCLPSTTKSLCQVLRYLLFSTHLSLLLTVLVAAARQHWARFKIHPCSHGQINLPAIQEPVTKPPGFTGSMVC